MGIGGGEENLDLQIIGSVYIYIIYIYMKDPQKKKDPNFQIVQEMKKINNPCLVDL